MRYEVYSDDLREKRQAAGLPAGAYQSLAEALRHALTVTYPMSVVDTLTKDELSHEQILTLARLRSEIEELDDEIQLLLDTASDRQNEQSVLRSQLLQATGCDCFAMNMRCNGHPGRED